MIMNKIKLSNGVEMPQMGYGVYQVSPDECERCVMDAISVSNFFPDHLIDLASNMEIAPMVNQVEMHVFNQQHEARKFMDEFGTHIMAWAPFTEGLNGLFTNPTLTQIGEKHGKTAAQVALRWLLQHLTPTTAYSSTTTTDRLPSSLWSGGLWLSLRNKY